MPEDPSAAAAAEPSPAGDAPSEKSVTELLADWNAGDRDAAARVLPVVYDELRRIAASYFRRERRDHTLQATALVHEAYVRLVEQSGLEWRSRSHFVGLAARVMRRVLVQHARRRGALKRGGDAHTYTLLEADAVWTDRSPDLLALDAALSELAEFDPQKARVVELRFFGGLTIDETADVLGVSTPTVTRQWRRARLWLYTRLFEEPAP